MNSKLDNKTLQAIQTADWDDIYPRAVKFAVSKLSFMTGTPREGLPKADEAHDIVNEAIRKIIEGCISNDTDVTEKGHRKWEPSRGPLLNYLFSVIKSDISHLYESEDYLSTSRMPITEESNEDECIEAEELLKRSCVPEKHADGINPDPQQSPEEIQIANELRDKLLKAVEGDGELEGIVLCMLDGFEKPGDIALQLGIKTSVVNNAKKRLKRIYESILPKRQ